MLGSGSLVDPDDEKDDALHYYANHTAQIEVNLIVIVFTSLPLCLLIIPITKMKSICCQIVRHDRTMEQIVFPVPNICKYLTQESKVRVFTTTERDDQGSKVNDFFQQFDNLYNEMRWQKKIRSESLHSVKIIVVAAEGGGRMVNHDYHPQCLVMSFPH